MSDNLTEQEVRRRLIIFLRIPTELWTDVLKLFPRRTLVQKIAPVCFRLKEISNKNVKSVHLIGHANKFTTNLEYDDPEAIKQVEHLAGNKCHLAGQFRLTAIAMRMRIREKSQAILRHCPDLLDDCQISLYFNERNKNSTMFLECLSHLEKAKPIVIHVVGCVTNQEVIWRHPTFQNCTRVQLFFWTVPTATQLMSTYESIFVWLHHRQPSGVDCNGSSAGQQVRCITYIYGYEHIDWLINRCSEKLRNDAAPADRSPYVFSFRYSSSLNRDWPGFGQFRRIENKTTGEVLTLDRVMSEEGGEPNYRLRRCLAEEEARGEEFYAGMFKRINGGVYTLKFGDMTPKVQIG